MAIHAEPAISTARNVSPFRTDYTTWKILAWTCPVFLFAVFVLWGIVAHNMPPFPPSATPDEVKAHFHDFRLPLLIALSICVTKNTPLQFFIGGGGGPARGVGG